MALQSSIMSSPSTRRDEGSSPWSGKAANGKRAGATGSAAANDVWKSMLGPRRIILYLAVAAAFIAVASSYLYMRSVAAGRRCAKPGVVSSVYAALAGTLQLSSAHGSVEALHETAAALSMRDGPFAPSVGLVQLMKSAARRSDRSLTQVSNAPSIMFMVRLPYAHVWDYLHGASAAWAAEVNAHGALVLAIDGQPESSPQQLVNVSGRTMTGLEALQAAFPRVTFLLDPPTLHAGVAVPTLLTALISKFMESPNLRSSSFDFIFAAESDVYFHPSRVAALLSSRSPDDPLYMGIPMLASDSCSSDVVPTDGAASHCDGSAFFLSRSTVRSIAQRGAECIATHTQTYAACGDVMLGACLRDIRLTCTPVALHSNAYPPPTSTSTDAAPAGDSKPYYPTAATLNDREAYVAAVAKSDLQPGDLLCPDPEFKLGSPRDGHISHAHRFTAMQRLRCATFFPVRVASLLSAPHARYTRFLITQKPEEPLLPSSNAVVHVAGSHATTATAVTPTLAGAIAAGATMRASSRTCRVAIGINSKASHTLQRNAARSTWLRIAAALGRDVIQPFFLLAEPKFAMAPHEETTLFMELSTNPDDILWLPNTQDCYLCGHRKAMTWLAWALNNTDCDYIVKMDDDIYGRVLPFLTHVAATHGVGAASNVYLGMLAGSFGATGVRPAAHTDPSNRWYMQDVYPHPTLPPFMIGHFMGVSRDLAEYIVRNAGSRPDMRVDDAAIGIIVESLWASSLLADGGKPVVYDSALGVFNAERVCTHDSAFDGPNYSHGFNVYDRYEDDLNGIFCTHVDRSTQPRLDGYQSDLHALVYKQSDREKAYAVTAPWTKTSKDEPPMWLHVPAIDNFKLQKHVHGGADVSLLMTAEDQVVTALAVNRARGMLLQATGCKEAHTLGLWRRDTWDAGFLTLSRCAEAPERSQLVFMQPTAGKLLPGVTVYDVPAADIAVTVPAGCFTEGLKSFLEATLPMLAAVPGGNKRILVGWGRCAAGTRNGDENALAAEVASFAAAAATSHPSVPVVIIPTSSPFTRASTLNAAIAAVRDDEIAVSLDLDMRVKPQYFLHARAFAQRGRSIYFPICFSRYNPRRIVEYMTHLNVSADIVRWYSNEWTVSSHTGMWISFGYGMVAAYGDDLRELGGFDAKQKTWGSEDNALYDAAKRSKLSVLHMIDSYLVHVYHRKSCTALIGTPKHRACVDVRILSEGSKMELGVALMHQQAAWVHTLTKLRDALALPPDAVMPAGGDSVATAQQTIRSILATPFDAFLLDADNRH